MSFPDHIESQLEMELEWLKTVPTDMLMMPVIKGEA